MKDFYYYTARGYTMGGHGDYVILTVISVPKGEAPPVTWRRKDTCVEERTGKLYSGMTVRCEHIRKLRELRETYPGLTEAR